MTRRAARNSADRLKVLLDDDASAPTVLTRGPAQEDEPPAASGATDPDSYGLRVVWQSEAELLEAAEFLLATRMRRDESLRVLHDAQLSRPDGPTEPGGGDEEHPES